jgi:molybdenum cofactor cytidylyltransferase
LKDTLSDNIGDNIDAVLMACGFSRRFGSADKLLALFRGKPLARYTLELVSSLSCFNRIFFVAASDPVIALADGLPVTVIKNENPHRGQRESIRLGVENSSSDYYLFFPCDQPLLDGDTVMKLLASRKAGCISQCVFQGSPGNPVLFSNAFRDDLLNLSHGERGRDIKHRYPDALVSVDVPREAALLDVDSTDALARLEGLIE